MTNPISHLSPPRLLKPVSGNLRNDGAPYVPLSPHKGVRNAVIIYQAIKNLPDSTLIRGDFDKRAQPLIYFPERPPKKIGQMNPVAAQNARFDRAEFASFMRSIVETSFKSAPARSPQIKAASDLRLTTLKVTKENRDFTVGDIRESLQSIAKSFHRQQLKNLTSPHRTQPGKESPLQAKRFEKFCDIKGAQIAQLCEALSIGMKGDDARNKTLIAVQAMKKMLFSYRILRDTEDLSLSDFLQRHSITKDVYMFAKLWLALSGPDRYGRTQFCTESWSLEMDRICPLIIKKYRDQKRVASGGDIQQEPKPADTVPLLPTNETANSPDVSRMPRVLKRRFRHPASPTFDVSAESPLLPVAALTRQSSVPQLRSGHVQSVQSSRSGIGRADSVIFKRINFSSVADMPSTAPSSETSAQQTQ
jgi:hypothetical protein